ncbi:MAG: SCP2 sterol-binding domain-containing protein [Acidimicrobiaceae bacterium]|nr:SCP2 sterol-binding domain-containing protein [Acidimicrobiaceae bacterium]
MAPEPLGEGWLEAVAAELGAVDAAGSADGVAQIIVSGSPSGTAPFYVVVAGGRVSTVAGRHREPDMVLSCSYPDFVQAWEGGLSLEASYMSGRMKLEGDQVLLFDGWRPLLRSPELRTVLAALR